jgi:hypothetical protein
LCMNPHAWEMAHHSSLLLQKSELHRIRFFWV